MAILHIIAWYGFVLSTIISVLNGLWYLLSSQIQSYHCKAMGQSWSMLPAGIQVMSLCFMKSAAAGMLSSGVALLALLFVPYRAGAVWAEWTVCVVALLQNGIILSRVAKVKTQTQGDPPLTLLALQFAVVVLSASVTIIGMVTAR